jgi:hypothetical protein
MVTAEKISLSKLKNLPPEQRVALLKKFEEQRKKEIERAEKELKSSEAEIETKKKSQRELEEKSRELLEKRVTPRQVEELEEIVEETQKPAEEGAARPVYGAPLEEIKRLYEIATPEVYEGVRELRNRAAQGRLSEEDEKRINFYEHQLSGVSVNEQYINDRRTKDNWVRIKTAIEQIEEYKNKPMW